eukprot:1283027-Prymnesium_polylepis.1
MAPSTCTGATRRACRAPSPSLCRAQRCRSTSLRAMCADPAGALHSRLLLSLPERCCLPA